MTIESLDLIKLRQEVYTYSTTINTLKSVDHGPDHWARVETNGIRLGRQTPGCDLLVVELFALFHDSMRDNDWIDPQHGARGWKLAVEFGVHRLLSVAQSDFLEIACVFHDAGKTSMDPTIGVCWDADRLDLGRVGITPDSKFLSTEAAKNECG